MGLFPLCSGHKERVLLLAPTALPRLVVPQGNPTFVSRRDSHLPQWAQGLYCLWSSCPPSDCPASPSRAPVYPTSGASRPRWRRTADRGKQPLCALICWADRATGNGICAGLMWPQSTLRALFLLPSWRKNGCRQFGRNWTAINWAAMSTIMRLACGCIDGWVSDASRAAGKCGSWS